LTKTEEGVHNELVIHALEAKIWQGFRMKGAVSISQEGPKKLDPAVGKEEAIPGVVSLEEGSRGTQLQLCLFQGATK